MTPSNLRHIIVAAAMASLVVTLVACSAQKGGPGARAEPPPAQGSLVDGYDCTTVNIQSNGAPTVPAPMRVPAGFEPVAAYRCNSFGAIKAFGDNNPDSALTADRLEGDVEALLEVLAVPDSKDSDGHSDAGDEVCMLSLEVPPNVWLVDAAGKGMRVHWPVNACGKTHPGSTQILEQFVAVKVPVSSTSAGLAGGVIGSALAAVNAPAGFHDGIDRESCGQFTLKQGETIAPVAVGCINDARGKHAAQLVAVSPTTEGDPIVTIYRTDVGRSGVKVFIDNEFDRWGAPTWSQRQCEMVASTNFLIGCTEL